MTKLPDVRHPDEALFAKAFGRAIRYARQQCGLSGTDLAARVGVWQQAVSRWETGKAFPSNACLLLIAQATGQPMSRLFAAAERAMDAMKAKRR